MGKAKLNMVLTEQKRKEYLTLYKGRRGVKIVDVELTKNKVTKPYTIAYGHNSKTMVVCNEPRIVNGDKLYDAQLYEKMPKYLYKVLGIKENVIITHTYGDTKEWTSRADAEKFFLDCMACSEGAERDRYVSIFLQLRSGAMECWDEDEVRCY